MTPQPSNEINKAARRHQLFAALCIFFLAAQWTLLRSLLALCLADERYTYIVLVPVISAAFFYLDRDQIFDDLAYWPGGVALILFGLVTASAVHLKPSLSRNLTLAAAGLVLMCTGAFALCYGRETCRRATFPLLFLFLIIPVPGAILDRLVTGLQSGSAEVSYLLFRAARVPVFRRGLVMSLPGVDIEVAPQCSGIRSTTALFIACLIVSRVLLRMSWTRTLAILSVFPIAVFRNSVRIVTLSLLAVYVDRQFLFGRLHRQGGLPFSLVGFAVLIPLVWLLRKCERRRDGGRIPPASAPAR